MFRTTSVAAIALFGMAMAGCDSQAPELEISRDMERSLLDTHYANAIDAGIIRQHTIQPNHFVIHTTKLNELGLRDIGVLANHYRIHGGVLSVRRGEAEATLYEERVREVQAALVARGVDVNRVHISDDLPAGDGLETDRVVEILTTADESEAAVYLEPTMPAPPVSNLPIASQ